MIQKGFNRDIRHLHQIYLSAEKGKARKECRAVPEDIQRNGLIKRRHVFIMENPAEAGFL
jgi:hypothetical protein